MCENIFTIKEVESILKIPNKSVRYLIDTRKLEHFKVSGKPRVSEKQIDAYLESVKVPSV